MEDISAKELAAWLNNKQQTPPLLIDVRESWELEICMLANSVHIPMGNIEEHCQELDKQREVVMICHHGFRSARSGRFVESQGFKVHNLVGGLQAWAEDVDTSMAQY